MRIFNIFYIIITLFIIGLGYYFSSQNPKTLSFYGFAESNETEINYNYPVMVDEIHVSPGQEVKAGDVLLKISRLKSKETLADEPYKIAELRSEAKLWTQRKKDQIEIEQNKLLQERLQIDGQIAALKKDLAFKKSLSQGLTSLEPITTEYDPIESRLQALNDQKNALTQSSNLKITSILNEIELGKNPYRIQEERINAEAQFAETQMVQQIIVKAPAAGLIGNVFCKEAEHVTAYRTLLSLYEPHSDLIRGFVHEGLTLEVQIGDNFKVYSLKDEKVSYPGKVIGLGSRIVEIPTRLRKMPDLKTYGREVLINITRDNQFLQKEKVALRHVDAQ